MVPVCPREAWKLGIVPPDKTLHFDPLADESEMADTLPQVKVPP